MKKLWNRLTAIAVAVGLMAATASPAVASQGELTVKDQAKLFTAEGIKAAKEAFAKSKYDSATKIEVVTFDGLPNKRKAEFAAIKDDKSARDRFVGDWARDEAKAEGAKGIFVLVSVNPNQIRVIASEQMRSNREFGEAKSARMQELLVNAFQASHKLTGDAQKQGHDVGLLKAVEYAGEQLIGTKAIEKSKKSSLTQDIKTTGEKAMNGGGGILGWVCLIGVVLLGAWLVIGLIRGLTGMGGGGMGGGGMGGGMMGGGGGGGFMSSLFGGMFGSMAGMWMYNNLFGGGMSSMSAGDYGGGGGYGGDTGGTAVGDDGNFDNGADAGGGGDWGGDAGGGGDFGGGDFGGGDFGGGGGGDFGGGGDW